jgi:hypothetical protein
MPLFIEFFHDGSIVFNNWIQVILLISNSVLFSASVHDEVILIISIQNLIIVLESITRVHVVLNQILLKFKFSFVLIKEFDILVVHSIFNILGDWSHFEGLHIIDGCLLHFDILFYCDGSD